MDALTEQIQNELQAIAPVVSDLLGWQGKWNGLVGLVELGFEGNGKKRYDCSIEIVRAVAQTEARWRVLIHEMVHAHSFGLSRMDYQKLKGWEEGPVEILQRTLRPQILERLGVVVQEEVFAVQERVWPYNPYVAAVELLRHRLGVPEDETFAFYANLLRQPLQSRPDYISDIGETIPLELQATFNKQFLLAHGRLCRPT